MAKGFLFSNGIAAIAESRVYVPTYSLVIIFTFNILVSSAFAPICFQEVTAVNAPPPLHSHVSGPPASLKNEHFRTTVLPAFERRSNATLSPLKIREAC